MRGELGRYHPLALLMMARRLLRFVLVFWCASWMAWYPVVANAVTIPTRQISPGVYGIAAIDGATVVSVIAGAITRVSPWVGAVTLGIELAKFIIQTTDGSIAVTTAGKRLLDSTPIQSVQQPNYTQNYCTTGHVGCASSFSQAVLNQYAPAGPCHLPGHTYSQTGGDGTYTATYTVSCDGFQSSTSFQMYVTCYGSSSYTATPNATAFNNKVATCTTSPPPDPATGGTKYWTPRGIAMPDGSVQWGWEKPSDPGVSNPNNVSPADQLNIGNPVNGVQPQVTITPNPDGGITVQTWNPEFNTATPPQQTGWTVQTTTINNAGNVTNTTIVINNQSGPPNTKPPTVDASTPPPTNPDGTPQSPQPAQNLQCGSLNCESTQQGIHSDTTGIHQDTTAIRDELQANGAPTLPDQASALAAAKASDLEQSQTISNAITLDQSHWFAWAWTPPAGTCTAPEAHLHDGVTVSFNYCPFVENIKLALGWLFAIFASWHVYGVLFRRDET